MTQTEQQNTMNLLLKEGPEVWLEYLRRRERGESGADLSLLTVFQFAAPRAKDQADVTWAEVAIRAAELEASGCSGVERDNALTSAMSLRAWFIARMGSRSGNLILDKEIVLNWIRDGLKTPLLTVTEKSALLWDNMAIAKASSNPDDLRRVGNDLSELRGIKRRLNVGKVLADSGELEANSDLAEWLEVRERLP